MSEVVTYAKAGVTPHNWMFMLILDRDTGDYVSDVEEVNAAEGWLIRHKRNAKGEFYLDERGEIAKERIEGRFALIARCS